MSAEYSVKKNAFTADGATHNVARIRGVADGLRRIGEFESAEMLTAYAERIEADERSVPVAWQNVVGVLSEKQRNSDDRPLFTRPPAQAAQITDSVSPVMQRRDAVSPALIAPTAEPVAQGDALSQRMLGAIERVKQHLTWRRECVPRQPSINELAEWVNVLEAALAAQPQSAASPVGVPDGWTRAEAKLHERKTVHKWLNNLHIESEEFGKPLCLLRRMSILCDRYADTCEQLSFEIRKQVGLVNIEDGDASIWISTDKSRPERNTCAIYWHKSEHGGFPQIADEWRDEHHLASASHWLPYQAPIAAAPSATTEGGEVGE